MPPKAQSKSKQGSAMKLLTAQEQEALKLRTERETESEILRRNVEASILMEKTAKVSWYNLGVDYIDLMESHDFVL